MWSVAWSIIAVVDDPDILYSLQHLTYETAKLLLQLTAAVNCPGG